MRREEQLDNLMADVTAKKQEIERLISENAKVQTDLKEMGEHAAALRGALLRYGDHSPNCPGREAVSETCPCGWMDNRNRVPGDPVIDQVGKLRELLKWIKRNHNGYPEGHAQCGVCKAIDQAVDESRCPQIHPFGRCDREAGHWGGCAMIQMRKADLI